MVITVGRQYGSGGREIGTMLAKQLGIEGTVELMNDLNRDEGIQ